MAKTSEDLVYAIASNLGKAVSGEALGQPEHESIDGKIDGVLSRISQIVYIGDRDDIPEELFDTIALIATEMTGPIFSYQKPDMAYVKSLENDLRYLVASDPTFQVEKAVYY